MYFAYLLADTLRDEFGDRRSMTSCVLGEGDVKDTPGSDAFLFFDAGVEPAVDLCDDDDSPISW